VYVVFHFCLVITSCSLCALNFTGSESCFLRKSGQELECSLWLDLHLSDEAGGWCNGQEVEVTLRQYSSGKHRDFHIQS